MNKTYRRLEFKICGYCERVSLLHLSFKVPLTEFILFSHNYESKHHPANSVKKNFYFNKKQIFNDFLKTSKSNFLDLVSYRRP